MINDWAKELPPNKLLKPQGLQLRRLSRNPKVKSN